jgi:hypothetical protein
VDRTTQLSPLGLQRLRVLDCLGGNSPHAPGYFEPAADSNIFDAFGAYVAQVSRQWAGASDAATVSLIAAARFLTGDLAAAYAIVDHFPAKAFKLDHGAGICLVMPLYALMTALPLPTDLKDTRRWLAGSAEQAALRAWLAEHRDQLRWVEADGVYLAPTTERSP